MKREKRLSWVIAAVLAFALAFGGIGCMVTGLGLKVESLFLLAVDCALFASVSAALFRLKWGSAITMCLLALGAWLFWRSAEANRQLQALLSHISRLYDSAYGWGILIPADSGVLSAPVDAPLAAIGCLVSVCASWTVIRRKPALPAAAAAVLPLVSCLVVTDTVPQVGYLFLLFLGLIVLVLTSHLRRSGEGQANSLTLLAAPAAAVFLGILFLAVPQEGYVNPTRELQQQILNWAEELSLFWEEQTTPENTGVGEKDREVDLRDIGPRVNHTYPVLEVTAGFTGTLYLRELDYDIYDGSGWTSGGQRQELFGGKVLPGILSESGNLTIRTNRGRELFFVPYYPQGLQELTGGRRSNGSRVQEYTYIHQALAANWQTLATPEEYPLSRQDRDQYLALPGSTRKAAEKLLTGLYPPDASTAEKANAIAAFVRGSARYDTDTPRMPQGEEDFALWFLEDSEQGYCVHFATATAVLLRAAGIPARYVTGYMLPVAADQTTQGRADQSHAWAEYYEPRLGLWLVLESTPGDFSGQATEPTQAPTESESTTPESGEATQAPSESTAPAQAPTEPVEEPHPTQPPAQEREPFRLPGWVGTLGKVLLWIAAVPALILGQRELRLALRSRGLRRKKSNALALARWREAELLFRLAGQPTPKELWHLAQKAKFSQHTLTAEELQVFDTQIRAARAACREKPWYLRLIDRYIFAAY